MTHRKGILTKFQVDPDLYFIRFKDSFDGETQPTDSGINETQDPLLHTDATERRLPGWSTHWVVPMDRETTSGNCREQLLRDKWGG